MALRLIQGYESDSSSDNEADAPNSASVLASSLETVTPAANLPDDACGLSPDSTENKPNSDQTATMKEEVGDPAVINKNALRQFDSSGAFPLSSNAEVADLKEGLQIPQFDTNVNRIDTISENKFSEQQIRVDSYESDGEKSTSTDSLNDSDNNWESFDDSDDDNLDNSNCATKSFSKNTRPFLKVKGELGLEDLPPIEDLKISVPHQDCEVIGSVYNIVDKLVIVQSLPNKPSLDLDTVLFLDNGVKVLGQIFDVFGQINEPFYSIRFNSLEHIKENNVCVGLNVYYAPKTDHTRFIVVSDLMRLKGSDASWQHDLEMPPEFLDYSDDEKEREAKKEYQRRKSQNDSSNSNNQNKRQKPTEFEEKMNKKNLLKTAEWNKKKKQNAQKSWSKQRVFNPFGYENNVFSSGHGTANISWPTNSNPGSANHSTSDNYNSNYSSVYSVVPQFNNATFIRPPRLSVPPMFRHMPPSMNFQNYPPNVHLPDFYSNVSANARHNLPNGTPSMSFSQINPTNFTSPPTASRSSLFNQGSSQPNTTSTNSSAWPVYSFPAPPGT